jgi:hypothetical protein
MGCYWEHVENLRKVLGTRHEHVGNSMGTYWEQGKKIPPTPTAPSPKNPEGKNKAPLRILIVCIKFLFPKQLVTIFNQDLYAHYKSGLFIYLER